MVKVSVYLLKKLSPSDKAAWIAARDSTPVAFGGVITVSYNNLVHTVH